MTNLDVTSSEQPGRIVVGVDGSGLSGVALDWAARQAELTQGTLHALTAWHWPHTYGYPLPVGEGYDPKLDAARVLEVALGRVRSQYPHLQIREDVIEGPATKILVDASAGAELLVVGKRGHGELSGMLLGSVSAFAVAHAHCPVVVVRS